jgi:hypothetical protein
MYPVRVSPSSQFYPAITFTQHLICALINPQCHFDMATNAYGLDNVMMNVYLTDLLDAQRELLTEYEQMRLLEE